MRMTCDDLLKYLSDYIDNNLDEELSAAAEEHLGSCHNCHVVLDTTRRSILMARRVGEQPSLSIEKREALFARLQAAFEQKSGEA